ncbi:ABC transporter substrate-binding protein [Phytoactinopolyspora halotolerans]|uniref:ABC transporter substrate-binding protein n=1 Tax=Phytoactinopolyspora halotolerans TaxID=1981512 RepID=A0A6L9SDL6_9ACTN|nr:ABC transporter substrate-binding protein [Phytoactinopolyspora halotolerans]NEE03233.1 ABC transporter substrate-binding protein [Phytoactinopolyspora halotolerans]
MYPTGQVRVTGRVRGDSLSRRAFLGAVSAMGFVAVSGCRSAVDEAEETGDDATGSGGGDPVSGGTLVTSVVAEPVPGAYNTGRPGNIFWCRSVLETLTLVDDSYDVVPVLATEWEFQDGNQTLVLTLREGVTYHSGRDFTSEDVVFAFDHAKEGGGLSEMAGVITDWEVEATGEYEVVISAPTPLQEIAFDILDTLPMIDRETYQGLEDGSEVVGTGPFVWSEYTAGTELKLTRNDSYWDPELPYLDAVEITVIADSTAQLSALRSGRTQMSGGMTTQDMQTVVDDEDFHLITNHGLVYAFAFDVTMPPFDDVRVRQAVAYAIDRERIAEQVMGGVAQTTSLPWVDSATGYPADLVDTYTYDPDRARQMIEEAGAAGAAVKIAIHAQPAPRSNYEIVARDLEAAGLKVSVEELSIPDFAPRRAANDLGQMFHIWSATAGQAPALMVNSLPELRAEGNTGRYEDDEYKELVEDLINSPDDETTTAALRALSEHLLEAAFVLPFVITPATSVRADALKDQLIGKYGRSFRAAYLEDA